MRVYLAVVCLDYRFAVDGGLILVSVCLSLQGVENSSPGLMLPARLARLFLAFRMSRWIRSPRFQGGAMRRRSTVFS